MSDTPRTDAEAIGGYSMGVLMGNGLRYALVQSDFARQLERELTEAKRGAARYEVVRKMNASQFAELLQRCLFQDLRFDDEVDKIGGIK